MSELQLGVQHIDANSCTDLNDALSKMASIFVSMGLPGPVVDPENPTYSSVYVTEVNNEYIFVIVGEPDGDPDGNGQLDPPPGSDPIIIPIGGGNVTLYKAGDQIAIDNGYIRADPETVFAMVKTGPEGIDPGEVLAIDDPIDGDIFPGDSVTTPGYLEHESTQYTFTKGALLVDKDGYVEFEDWPEDPTTGIQHLRVMDVINASENRFTSEEGVLRKGTVYKWPRYELGVPVLDPITGEPLFNEAFVLGAADAKARADIEGALAIIQGTVPAASAINVSGPLGPETHVGQPGRLGKQVSGNTYTKGALIINPNGTPVFYSDPDWVDPGDGSSAPLIPKVLDVVNPSYTPFHGDNGVMVGGAAVTYSGNDVTVEEFVLNAFDMRSLPNHSSSNPQAPYHAGGDSFLLGRGQCEEPQ